MGFSRMLIKQFFVYFSTDNFVFSMAGSKEVTKYFYEESVITLFDYFLSSLIIPP